MDGCAGVAYNKNTTETIGETTLANRDANIPIDRAPRFLSHAIVEVRKFKHLPIFVQSGVLLDISSSGFKLEFTAETVAKPGDMFWLNIPLTPLGIYAPPRILHRIECRWFDAKRFRIGGIFKNLRAEDIQLLENVVETLKMRGKSI
jgi:PilZ domain